MAEKFSFSKAYKKIEEINEWFQGEDIDIDKALEKYKEGMELIEKCQERLKETENKFEDIKNEYAVGEGMGEREEKAENEDEGEAGGNGQKERKAEKQPLFPR